MFLVFTLLFSITSFAGEPESALIHAVKRGDVEGVIQLLGHGVNPNCTQNVTNYTPLMIAGRHHQPKIAEILIQYGANASISGNFGKNALHMAAHHDAPEVVRVLLQNTTVNLNVKAGFPFSMCALAFAARIGSVESVRIMLLESKIEPDAGCRASAVEMAQHNQHFQIVELLK